MNIVQRVVAPTPSFFAQLRNIGFVLTTVSSAVAGFGPGILPAIVVKIAGYLAVAGGVASAVSQTVTEPPAETTKADA